MSLFPPHYSSCQTLIVSNKWVYTFISYRIGKWTKLSIVMPVDVAFFLNQLLKAKAIHTGMQAYKFLIFFTISSMVVDMHTSLYNRNIVILETHPFWLSRYLWIPDRLTMDQGLCPHTLTGVVVSGHMDPTLFFFFFIYRKE